MVSPKSPTKTRKPQTAAAYRFRVSGLMLASRRGNQKSDNTYRTTPSSPGRFASPTRVAACPPTRNECFQRFPFPRRFPRTIENERGTPSALVTRHNDDCVAQLSYRTSVLVEELAVSDELLRDVVWIFKAQKRLLLEPNRR